ncbi:DUF554 domain-containing protein [Romboutsia sp.]|uniref:DUF554 domain-containing protein n=1 Tax=Romboutsia sp. TaxID=1965302 RepID=UPI003F39564B
MIGTIVNCLAIVGGCMVGLIIKERMTEKISNTIMNGLALCVLYIGISGAIDAKNPLIMIVSIALGGLIGELIDIDKRLSNLGDKLESKFIKKENQKENSKVSISQGFVSASLIFCVGAMAIVGSLQSGLTGNHETLFAKSIIDGIASIIFSASLGIGVMFSALSVFIYQGSITIGASFLSGVLSDPVINCMGGVGSLLIIGLGLNVLKSTNIKVANLLPAVFLPIIFGILGII